MTRVAVLGAGSWGTAFAMVLSDAGADVVLWARRTELAEAITREHQNPDYHPGIELPPALWATSEPAEALRERDLVVLAVPSQVLRGNLAAWAPLLPAGAPVVSLMKGVEVGTAKRMSEVVCEVAGLPPERVVVVSGPNLSREIVTRQPSASVIACVDESAAVAFQQACMTPYFRPYTDTDVVGVELGGAVKNVIALACGMAEGMGYGDNTRATIITRGLAETMRLGLVLGADPQTFAGLAGLGDLVATCTSRLSRNRTFGERIGRGESVAEIVASTRQVAEGVTTCESVLALARAHAVDVPITQAVVDVVRDGMPVREMAGRLMGRAAKPEKV
ncbi:MAG TPA: NAD(P)H-dependent glycerol-3-phosphate dehydrogenase [Actinomycetes bacterium]|nr:NAD(P)H-dependent glycerol-3-phosphate dehydrogenase [Actinomycetes bacterium]